VETLATPRAQGARGQRSPDVRFDVRAKELPLYWFMKHGNEGGGFLYNHLSNDINFNCQHDCKCEKVDTATIVWNI
jgi:hypothetical protein